MNYKIDYNFLEITNSPSIEYYLEKQARAGWLVQQIYLGSIFIFKKIKPAELSFSILSYELTESNWIYVTDSYDLYIYYKEYHAEANSHGLAAENEFEILEAIAKKRIQGHWLQIILFLLLGWLNLGGLYTSPDFLKDGTAQLFFPFILIGIASAIWGIFHIRRFLKHNRKHLAEGNEIQYSDSLFLVPSTTFFIGSILLILFLIHFLYMGVVSNSFIPLTLILVFISFLAGEKIYRILRESTRMAGDGKKIGGLGILLLLAMAGAVLGIYKETGQPKNPNLGEYKVLTVDMFPEGELDIEGTLEPNFSLLVPKSYEYYYISTEGEYVKTEYSRALATDFARDLFDRYVEEKKRDYKNSYLEEIKLYFNEGIFSDYLTNIGISEGDLIRLKNIKQEDAERIAQQLIAERSIVPADTAEWNADEAYFLSYTRDEILIRKAKEVFYLRGKDFTNSLVIEKTKEKLSLE